MSKKAPDNLSKHTLFLRTGDFALLQEHFPKKGASLVIRSLVSNFVDRLNPRLSPEELSELEPSDD